MYLESKWIFNSSVSMQHLISLQVALNKVSFKAHIKTYYQNEVVQVKYIKPCCSYKVEQLYKNMIRQENNKLHFCLQPRHLRHGIFIILNRISALELGVAIFIYDFVFNTQRLANPSLIRRKPNWIKSVIFLYFFQFQIAY